MQVDDDALWLWGVLQDFERRAHRSNFGAR
jgi:hypothetical protein